LSLRISAGVTTLQASEVQRPPARVRKSPKSRPRPRGSPHAAPSRVLLTLTLRPRCRPTARS
jgi:hypothetical protein